MKSYKCSAQCLTFPHKIVTGRAGQVSLSLCVLSERLGVLYLMLLPVGMVTGELNYTCKCLKYTCIGKLHFGIFCFIIMLYRDSGTNALEFKLSNCYYESQLLVDHFLCCYLVNIICI